VDTVSSGPVVTPLNPNTESCMLHPFESADRICGTCGNWHCDACLVTPWGPRKPALCVACAIQQGGVRKNSGARQSRSSREIRQVERERKRAARDEARRPVVISPVGLQKVDFPDDEPKRGLLGRFRKDDPED